MKSTPNRILTGFAVKWVFLLVYLRMLWFLFLKYKNPIKARKAWLLMRSRLAVHQLDHSFHKLIAHEGRYFISCNFPSFPAAHIFEKLLAIAHPSEQSLLDNIGMAQIALTKKCPLNCEHCYEGKVLNQPEAITLDEHHQIVKKLQDHQVLVIQFGGGEPLNRFDDLITILSAAKRTSDFWIYTSGYGLTQDKASLLKRSGLTGVSVSIDHYEASEHNRFRRNDKSFTWALAAVQHVKSSEMLLALSICVTNDFCTPENLMSYYQFALDQGADFVQILEPRSTGNFEGQDVELTPSSISILESFFLEISNNKAFNKYPILQYYGYQQRRIGCIGAAERYIYIDTDGCIQACPFCSNKKAHFLYGDLNNDLKALRLEGCFYSKSTSYEAFNS
jgi:MoaA/NifB/PqqE/SkfB family radical SAM enzyme